MPWFISRPPGLSRRKILMAPKVSRPCAPCPHAANMPTEAILSKGLRGLQLAGSPAAASERAPTGLYCSIRRCTWACGSWTACMPVPGRRNLPRRPQQQAAPAAPRRESASPRLGAVAADRSALSSAPGRAACRARPNSGTGFARRPLVRVCSAAGPRTPPSSRLTSGAGMHRVRPASAPRSGHCVNALLLRLHPALDDGAAPPRHSSPAASAAKRGRLPAAAHGVRRARAGGPHPVAAGQLQGQGKRNAATWPSQFRLATCSYPAFCADGRWRQWMLSDMAICAGTTPLAPRMDLMPAPGAGGSARPHGCASQRVANCTQRLRPGDQIRRSKVVSGLCSVQGPPPWAHGA
ncbi:hypothetical protein FQR65_LT20507 [Abscondita terminalis]|nr:hypothetical protein FQR65_LT20507 [Abscondita terminalis]